MIQALQRDLYLTEEQAHTRLLNEIRLTEVEANLRKELGAEFSGSWFSGGLAQTLVVATTDRENVSRITAQGAQAEIVSRSLTELEETIREVDKALSTESQGGLVRYIDVRSNTVVVLSDAPSTTKDVIMASAANKVAVRVVPSVERPRLMFGAVGGLTYYNGPKTRCSVGFSVTKGTKKGFVTAGHCGKAGDIATDAIGNVLGTFQASTVPDSPRGNFAWVAMNDNWTPDLSANNGARGTMSVAGSREAVEGASVCQPSPTTGWHCGTILQRKTSITYPQKTLVDQVRTSVCAESSDSGGPFIAADQAQGVASGGSGDCVSGGFTYFQPVNEILTTYDLTLVTTTGTDNQDDQGDLQAPCTDHPKAATGTLSNGRSVYQPNNRSYRSTTAGVHAACLDANDGVDFDFDLDLQKWDGRSWATVATSDSPNADEKISYTGTAGDYRYRVTSFLGTGPYTLKYTTP
ncbi:S1 family peptidase [Streptosporangium subroseum]|nr:S1 family peptidase [Streptosporangium subroseum]